MRPSSFWWKWPRIINQPLPRTPRESQQLLNALTSSFRRQLDREFPTEQEPTAASGALDGQHGGVVAVGIDSPRSSVQATDRHLRSILENPLFRVVPSRPAPGGSAAEEQPMAVFDERVASGSVTRVVLLDCLQKQLMLSTSPQNSVAGGSGVRDAMKNSRAGSKVVDWFWASDSAARKTLFKSRTATSYLLKFMVAEGLQDTVLLWLRLILKRDVGGSHGKIPKAVMPLLFSNMLEDFMAAELRYGHGVDAALAFYIRVCKMYSSLIDPLGVESTQHTTLLLAAASRLSHWIIQHSEDVAAEKASAAVYEQFRDVIASLFPSSPWAGCVSLYHPTTPAPEPLVAFMKQIASHSYWQGKNEWKSGWRRESWLHACFDALRILVDQKNYEDASSLAQSLQVLLPQKSSDAVRACGQKTSGTNRVLDRLDFALA